jgi:hypothetical protein
MSDALIQEIHKMHAEDRRVVRARRKFEKAVKFALDQPPGDWREVLLDRAIELARNCRRRLPDEI